MSTTNTVLLVASYYGAYQSKVIGCIVVLEQITLTPPHGIVFGYIIAMKIFQWQKLFSKETPD
jgi:hypothetical protein